MLSAYCAPVMASALVDVRNLPVDQLLPVVKGKELLDLYDDVRYDLFSALALRISAFSTRLISVCAHSIQGGS